MQLTEGLVILESPRGLHLRALWHRQAVITRSSRSGTRNAGPVRHRSVGRMIGRATRQSERVMTGEDLRGTLKLGVTTATDDPDSPEHPFRTHVCPGLSRTGSEPVCGRIMQAPPGMCPQGAWPADQRSVEGTATGAATGASPVRVDSIQLVQFDWPWFGFAWMRARDVHPLDRTRPGSCTRVGAT